MLVVLCDLPGCLVAGGWIVHDEPSQFSGKRHAVQLISC